MGIVNVTPDSFSRSLFDGEGALRESRASAAAVMEHAQLMLAAGADIIDIGGESTRPGANPVTAEEEIERTRFFVQRLRQSNAVVSIDTTKAAVAAEAINAGAQIINDISGGRFDDDMFDVAARADAYIMGHVRATSLAGIHAPENASQTFEQVLEDMASAVAKLPSGLRAKTIADPCLGFGKHPRLNMALIRDCDVIARRLEMPVLIGHSRKRFVRHYAAAENLEALDDASAALSVAAADSGAHMVRVHDVEKTVAALRATAAIRGDG